MNPVEQLTHQTNENRYVLSVADQEVGEITYRLNDDVIDLRHTGVEPEYGGRGYGAKLVKFALDDARKQGYRVIPSCPFVARYVERNEQYQDLLAS